MNQQTDTNINPKLEQALTLLEKGWAIIPIGLNKKPLIEWKRYQVEKPTPEEVRSWFDKYSPLNLAVVTGKNSGLVIIDIDPRHGGTDEQFRELKTVKVKTGGGGQHIYFQYEERIENKTGLLPGIDLRGEGGYAIIPPSKHESGQSYEWINNPHETNLLPLPDFVKEWIGNFGRKQNTDLKEMVMGVTEGKRNSSAASLVGKLLAKFPKEDWENDVWPLLQGWNSKNTPPLPEEELRSVFESIKEKELSNPNVKGKLKVKKNKENGEVSDEPEEEKMTTSFFVAGDGKVGEEVYDPKTKIAKFAVFDKDEVSYQDFIKDGERVIYPIEGAYITQGVVFLPSMASEYDTEVDLLNRIRAFIHTYVDLTQDWEEWSAYYVLLSWVYDKLPVCPYLCALGPSDSGKTRFVQTVGSICYKPIMASGSITASPVFRVLDRFRGTLIINEFDYIGDFNNEIIVILNNGFEAGLPVMRTEGDKEKEVKVFQVFGPKLFSTRKRKNDWAFESRLLTINMKSTKRTDIPPFLLDDFKEKALNLRNMLLMFRLRRYSQPTNLRTNLFTGVSGRLRQTLLSITSVIDSPEFLAQAESFAVKMQKELKATRGLDLDGTVYQVLVDCWEGNDKRPLLKDVAKKVKEIAELEKISSRAVGNIVRDELGFQTGRFAHGGNFVIIMTQEQLDVLKERYEESEQDKVTANPKTTSPSSPGSTQAQESGEVGEFGELADGYKEEVTQLTITALAELTKKDGFVRGYDVAQKVGCPYLWIKQVMETLVGQGKVLQLGEGKDMWAVSLATREQLGFVNPSKESI